MADVARLLETLHPMREPPPPAPVLPTLAMAALGFALALTAIVLAWQARRRHAVLRRGAMAALEATRRLAPGERLTAQAQLLRRLARRLGGEAAASAQGRAWLETLDRLFSTRFFTEGAGRAYGEALYRPAGALDVDALDAALAGLLAKMRT